MKQVVKYAALGVSGVVLFKLVAAIFLPTLAMIFGLLGLTVKLAIFAAVLFFLYSIFRKPRDEREIEIEVN